MATYFYNTKHSIRRYSSRVSHWDVKTFYFAQKDPHHSSRKLGASKKFEDDHKVQRSVVISDQRVQDCALGNSHPRQVLFFSTNLPPLNCRCHFVKVCAMTDYQWTAIILSITSSQFYWSLCECCCHQQLHHLSRLLGAAQVLFYISPIRTLEPLNNHRCLSDNHLTKFPLLLVIHLKAFTFVNSAHTRTLSSWTVFPYQWVLAGPGSQMPIPHCPVKVKTGDLVRVRASVLLPPPPHNRWPFSRVFTPILWLFGMKFTVSRVFIPQYTPSTTFWSWSAEPMAPWLPTVCENTSSASKVGSIDITTI